MGLWCLQLSMIFFIGGLDLLSEWVVACILVLSDFSTTPHGVSLSSHLGLKSHVFNLRQFVQLMSSCDILTSAADHFSEFYRSCVAEGFFA